MDSQLIPLWEIAGASSPAASWLEPPLSRDYQVLTSSLGEHVFVVNGSRLYDVDAATASRIRHLLQQPEPDAEARQALESAFGNGHTYIDGQPLPTPPLRSLSLNVAQSCNLGCQYCYADEGRFGSSSKFMSTDIACQAVDRLLAEAEPGVDVIVGYMGGEPLLNRRVVHQCTRYAAEQAQRSGHRVRFSLTTNATLVTPEDAALFREHAFAVTVSVDGPKALHDRLRPAHKGGGSYDEMCRGLALIMADGGPGHVSARITVTPHSGALLPVLRHVVDMGVGDAGFAPVQVSPNPAYAFGPADFEWFLNEMIRCGEAAKAALLRRERFPFSNFETALNEIHRGSHRPYPCGAGAAYLSVNAEGELYACHRLVDAENWHMGNVSQGSDQAARQQHLNQHHVDRQLPCRNCWARYLCGGGCYHEVEQRGRPHCDYVRGWLAFCLSAYAELAAQQPAYFRDPLRYFDVVTANR
ncbi:MAG: hypothetical protein ETSY2_35865 [Candidatus Entotheonella gemina]|uniref:Radical SAM core domain-containing protein n=1 Tax=Candidatus Entotheonella gemina TaxID=1429439 RepID=W4LWJ4_9BACT|nr:MAG: hypothetical protein ETSY2_35865 [Candidatus Entotheonella gemina]